MCAHHETTRSGHAIKAPDGGWGWMVVFGSFMIHIITDGVTYSFGVFYDEFLNYFKEGKGPTAWILSILVGVTLCSGPISSLLVNRWGCRAVTIVGSILATVCMVLSIWATSIFILYITIGIGAGLGFGLIYLPAIVSVSTYFEKKRSLATGIAVCGSGFGTFIFAPFITKLLTIYTWQISMLIIAGIVFLCVIFGILFKPLKLKEVEEDAVIPLKNSEGQTNIPVTGSYSNFYLATRNGKEKVLERPWSSGNFLGDYGTIKKETKDDVITSTRSEGGRRTRDDKPANIFERPDIFYQRSLSLSEEYYIPDESEESIEGKTRTKLGAWFKDVSMTIHKMLDLALFKDSIFILFTLSNFLTSIGFNVPYVYMVSRAKSLGISGNDAGLLLAIIGIANTIGRIFLGYLSDKPWVNRLHVYNICLTLCGIATAMSALCTDFITLGIYCAVFGFTIGAYVGLTSVILVDLLGLHKLTNAFGLLLLFQGIASFIGPPIAGWLYDLLKSYNPGFYVAGITIALSGIILFIIPVIQRHRIKQDLQNLL